MGETATTRPLDGRGVPTDGVALPKGGRTDVECGKVPLTAGAESWSGTGADPLATCDSELDRDERRI